MSKRILKSLVILLATFVLSSCSDIDNEIQQTVEICSKNNSSYEQSIEYRDCYENDNEEPECKTFNYKLKGTVIGPVVEVSLFDPNGKFVKSERFAKIK